MWIKSCISSLLGNMLRYLDYAFYFPAASPVFILPSPCYVGFFNGKGSGILVYFNSDKGNLFCHVICDGH